MSEKKDNSFLLRLSEEETRQLNDGWFLYVSEFGKPISKTEYIRVCIRCMLNVLKEVRSNDFEVNGPHYITKEDLEEVKHGE